MSFFSFLPIVICCGVLLSCSNKNDTLLVAEVEIEYTGQFSSGSIFEISNNQGQAVAGLGLEDSFQTGVHINDGWLNLFVDDGATDFKLEWLGKGSDYYNAELMRLSGKLLLIPLSNSHYNKYYLFDLENNKWEETNISHILAIFTGQTNKELGSTFGFCGHLRSISNGYAVMRHCIILPSGEILSLQGLENKLNLPNNSIVPFYYSEDRIVAYSSKLSEGVNQGQTLFVACTISNRLIDIENCSTFIGALGEHNLYAVASYKEKTFISTNAGSVLVFDPNLPSFKFLRKNNKKSYQLYAATRYKDSVLFGEYPYGSVLQLMPEGLDKFNAQIPLSKEVLRSLPETQVLHLYRGDLYAGVWPWGQLWRYTSSAKEWSLTSRLFTQPEISNDYGPYYAQRKGRGNNDLGQRIPHLISAENSLYGITSSKNRKIKSSDDFSPVTEKGRERYGELFRLTRTGALSVQGPNRVVSGKHILRIEIHATEADLFLDGKIIGSTLLSRNDDFCASDIKVGSGVYGTLEKATAKLLSFDNNIKCQ